MSPLPQYISAVSRYHVLHNLPSPTLAPFVRALTTAYAGYDSEYGTSKESRIDFPASLVYWVLEHGLRDNDPNDLCSSSTVMFAFFFQVRDVTVEAVQLRHLTCTEYALEVLFHHRKGSVATSRRRRPLLFSPAWDASKSLLTTQSEVDNHSAQTFPSILDFLRIPIPG